MTEPEQQSQQDPKTDSPKPWQLEEWKCILERRRRAFPHEQQLAVDVKPKHLTGLALSGGGIRSALFNDGFVQSLSHRRFLRYVDYHRTVSGGGYLGGHLIAQSDPNSERCFHDDPDRSNLGRDPRTGLNRYVQYFAIAAVAVQIILDFFNAGIGQRVRRTDRSKKRMKQASRHPLVMAVACCALAILLCYWLLELRWSLLLIVPTVAMFCHCWNHDIGSPGWIRSLRFLKEAYHETDFNQN